MVAANDQFSKFSTFGFEDAMRFSQIALDSIERMVKLNVKLSRSSLENDSKLAYALVSAKDPQDVLSQISLLASQSLERTADNSRELYDIVSEVHSQFANLTKERMASLNGSLADSVAALVKSAQQQGNGKARPASAEKAAEPASVAHAKAAVVVEAVKAPAALKAEQPAPVQAKPKTPRKTPAAPKVAKASAEKPVTVAVAEPVVQKVVAEAKAPASAQAPVVAAQPKAETPAPVQSKPAPASKRPAATRVIAKENAVKPVSETVAEAAPQKVATEVKAPAVAAAAQETETRPAASEQPKAIDAAPVAAPATSLEAGKAS
jgi:phasin family protein